MPASPPCVRAALPLLGSRHRAPRPNRSGGPVPGRRKSSGDDVVRLSEFAVTADADRGYIAAETMTGTRVATKIIDLPYTVNVLTGEFFEDFGIFELADNITHIGGFTDLDIGGNFNLRGFSSTSQLRDGFFRLGRYGSSNVDRMEVIKGSNAAIYGRTLARRHGQHGLQVSPRSRAGQRLSLNYGDDGTQRVTLETTGPIGRALARPDAYILTASHYQRDFDQEYARNRNYEYYGALKPRLSPTPPTSSSPLEYLLQDSSTPRSTAAPLVTDQKRTTSNLDDEAVGYAWNLAAYQRLRPQLSQLDRGNTGLTAVYDKTPHRRLEHPHRGNYYKVRRWDYNQNTGWGAVTRTHQPPATAPSPPSPVRARRHPADTTLIIEDGGGFQGRHPRPLLDQPRTIEHRTLATLDINDYYRWDPSGKFAGATNPDIVAWNAVRTVHPRPATPSTPHAARSPYFLKWFDGARIGRKDSHPQAAHHRRRRPAPPPDSALLQRPPAHLCRRPLRRRALPPPRLHRLRPPATPPAQMFDKTMSALKPNAGLNYKLTPHLRAFVNYSESYFVPQSDNDRHRRRARLQGRDRRRLGLRLQGRPARRPPQLHRLRLLRHPRERPRHRGRGGAARLRQLPDAFPPRRRPARARLRDRPQLAGHPHRLGRRQLGPCVFDLHGLRLRLPAVRRPARPTDRTRKTAAPTSSGPPTAGRLRGFSANLGVTHMASTPTEAPNAGDTYVTAANGQRVLQRTTYQWRLRIPSYTLWNVGARYRLSGGGSGYDHTFGINVNNLFDADYVRANRLLGEKRAVYFTYSLNRTPGRR
jgi:iron complex outermembrane receptor protein